MQYHYDQVHHKKNLHIDSFRPCRLFWQRRLRNRVQETDDYGIIYSPRQTCNEFRLVGRNWLCQVWREQDRWLISFAVNIQSADANNLVLVYTLCIAIERYSLSSAWRCFLIGFSRQWLNNARGRSIVNGLVKISTPYQLRRDQFSFNLQQWRARCPFFG